MIHSKQKGTFKFLLQVLMERGKQIKAYRLLQ